MKLTWKHFLVVILMGAAMKAGVVMEADHVQTTCENPDSLTEINGVQYLCLTPAQAARIQRQLQERGT